MSKNGRVGAALAALRAHALSYPGAREDHPWGELVAKVREKVFVFFGRAEEGGLSLSVKLPGSAHLAFDLPYCEPTGYGLGKAGWVTARFAPRDAIPVEMLKRWIDESYRAVAPKRLAATISPPPLAGGDDKRPGKRSARRGRRSRGSGARAAATRAPARARRGPA